MDVVAIPAFSDNYIWALLEEDQPIFYCVDPGDALPVLHFAQEQKRTLTAILLTHHHHDHIGGVAQLKSLYPDCVIYGPEDPRIPCVSHTVDASQSLCIGSASFQILPCPGHTSTHISYYEPQKQWLFCGDTLFSAGCGRVFDGTIEQLHRSLMLFKALPKNTKVFCAHEYTVNNLKFAHTVEPNNNAITQYLQRLSTQQPPCSLPSTIEQELLINPFLRMESSEVRAYAQQYNTTALTPLEIIRILRHQKNKF